MEFLKSKYTSLKKTALHYFYPNQNPNDIDKQAFKFLDDGQVDLFIEHMEKNDVNLNVKDWNSASLLIKAQDVANNTSAKKKLIPEQELRNRAIKAVNYLVKRGVDIDYQDKNGCTALLSASHWENTSIAGILLNYGANPNLGYDNHGFFLNPLISAIIKNNKTLIIMLVSYGADPTIAEKNDSKVGNFKLSEQQKILLKSSSNIAQLVRRRQYEIAKGEKTALSMVSDLIFEEMCFYV